MAQTVVTAWMVELSESGTSCSLPGINSKAFTATQPSLSRFRRHKPLPVASKFLPHSRSPTPTPRTASEEELRAGGGGRSPAG